MFDFLRDRGSTAGEKRLEVLGAYLDNALTAAERERLEGQLERDADMRDELERMRALKLQMRAMPRRRVPRSFALDPTLYARPKSQPLLQLYPVLRGATALTAFFLIFTLALGIFQGQFAGGGGTSAPQAVSESVVEEEIGAFEAAESAPMEAPAAADEQERAMATSATEIESGAAPAELAVEEEAITETYSLEALPPAEGTGIPEGDLAVTEMPQVEMAVEAPTEEAAEGAAGDAALVPAPSVAEADLSAKDTSSEQVSSEAAIGSAVGSFLLPIQIALAILFILLLALWLIARRRARAF